MDSHSWPCPSCAEERVFVQPPCLDGCTDDGGECPEWACVECGTAFYLGDLAVDTEAVVGRRAA